MLFISKCRIQSRGFTLIELIVVLTLLSIIGLSSVPVLASYKRHLLLQENQALAVTTLRRAQTRAITGAGEFSWGVHFENNEENGDRISMFEGDDFAKALSREDIPLSGQTRFSQITVRGGGRDVIFSRIDGNTEQEGMGKNNRALCLTESSDRDTCSVSISIEKNGRIDYL